MVVRVIRSAISGPDGKRLWAVMDGYLVVRDQLPSKEAAQRSANLIKQRKKKLGF
ncbi:MAG: hypothetical protein GTO44_09970 [Hydrotalea flava]|nr:hypothetical protein [Hydrotalea flava]NIN15379.1 hypothetical protein [Hydrotalea flava]